MDIMRSRGKIIDATLELVQTSGFDGVTIAAVAESAGVSRQTVYSIFGTREDLVSQSVAHLTLMAMEDIQAHAAATDNPTDFLIELVMAGRHFARTTPVLKAMFQADQGSDLLGLSAHPNREQLRERLSIFSAYRVPPAIREKLYPSITPVNSFRLLFRGLFGDEMPLLADRSFYSAYESPFRYVELADE